jgi:alginate O-acetyltransferase complex protein AlgI
MNLGSHGFVFLFLPLAWAGFRAVAAFERPRLALGFLSLASLGFLALASPWNLLLVGASASINYLLGRRLARGGAGTGRFLALGVAANLGVLLHFKYAGFLLDNLGALSGQRFAPFEVALPLGLSFLTFQQVAYLVDCRRGAVGRHSFLEFLFFSVYFPKAAQGPILRFGEVLSQLRRPAWFRLDAEQLALGTSLLILGLFKKIVVADSLGPWVAEVFDGAGAPTAMEAWSGSLAYTFQIYFDFSGYSDMALGLGRLFGVQVPVNFDSPYRATSVVEFWRRWHISLSFFLRDYLYIPLGGNRHGPARKHLNLMVTMVLGGLWHGAAWTFVAWGALHGAGLCLNHGWRALSRRLGVALPAWLGWLATFLFVDLCWVCFRAPSFPRALEIVRGMLGRNGLIGPERVFLEWAGKGGVWSATFDPRLPVLALLLVAVLALPGSWRWCGGERRSRSWWSAVALALLLVFSLLQMTEVKEFVYDRF